LKRWLNAHWIIIVANPLKNYLAHSKEIDRAIVQVLEGGQYILGEQVSLFEKEFAEFIGTKYAVGVNSGTDALRLALIAADVHPGWEVITVSYAPTPVVSAIQQVGAIPVLVDIDLHSYTMNLEALEKAITDKTKAIIPVHMYGYPMNISTLVASVPDHIAVIEDCCQAHGAVHVDKPVGSFGAYGCFSFYPTKNLGGFGDGGMITTDRDPSVLYKLREYGWKERYIAEIRGVNSRLDEVQAAVLRVKLKHLRKENIGRNDIAVHYKKGLDQIIGVHPPIHYPGHVYHMFTVILSWKRDAVYNYMKGKGIGVNTHIAVPIHCQPVHKYIKRRDLPMTELAAGMVLNLPIYPEMESSEVDHVCEVLEAGMKGAPWEG
jgi:dTDP-4-amino-4,6-dideoxygalactose transaminase